jgi:hypothetical protein
MQTVAYSLWYQVRKRDVIVTILKQGRVQLSIHILFCTHFSPPFRCSLRPFFKATQPTSKKVSHCRRASRHGFAVSFPGVPSFNQLYNRISVHVKPLSLCSGVWRRLSNSAGARAH